MTHPNNRLKADPKKHVISTFPIIKTQAVLSAITGVIANGRLEILDKYMTFSYKNR